MLTKKEENLCHPRNCQWIIEVPLSLSGTDLLCKLLIGQLSTVWVKGVWQFHLVYKTNKSPASDAHVWVLKDRNMTDINIHPQVLQFAAEAKAVEINYNIIKPNRQ